ncbi:hypothetical protein HPG69_000592 [Diceros bicornis minor]|uniref:Uncharacterized protein n=1 Tax=Diceros bicornis minor TaxID=77932 RepID=A0A7J7FI95_DICBM|nr:hypothetical protein HPG69_000592 [Diceros bicornis minor]
MNQKYDEVMVTYMLLAYKKSDLESYTSIQKSLPSADPTNSCPPYPSCKVQHGVSANPKQRDLCQHISKPTITTFNSYSGNSQSSSTENQWSEKDQELGQKASSTAKVPASPLPGLDRKTTPARLPSVSLWPSPVPTQQQQWWIPSWNQVPQGVFSKGNSHHTGQLRQEPDHQNLPERVSQKVEKRTPQVDKAMI